MKNYPGLASAIASSLLLYPLLVTPPSWGNRLDASDYPPNSFLHNSINRERPLLAHREEDTLAVPEGKAVPRVTLIIHPDARKGWNLELQVANFKFAPERVNQEGDYTEGHAHLYINGKKITRIYGNWYYLSSLEPGRNKITVTLNANNHHTLTYKGTVIENSQFVEVK